VRVDHRSSGVVGWLIAEEMRCQFRKSFEMRLGLRIQMWCPKISIPE